MLAIKILFYRYGHFLPDNEFPILDMKQPSFDKNGSPKFESIKVQVPNGKKCMVCGKLLKAGNAISAHDPNRSGDIMLPRQTNFLPPRYGIHQHSHNFRISMCFNNSI